MSDLLESLPYAASLKRFTCFCQTSHKAEGPNVIILCPCGRTWLQVEASPPDKPTGVTECRTDATPLENLNDVCARVSV